MVTACAAATVMLAACTPPAPAGAPTPARAHGTAGLRSRIDALIGVPAFRTAEWAILVVDPSRGDTLYSHDPALLMVPASNMKIITSSVALTQLGPGFRFATTFSAHGRLAGGILDGDLVVTGRGDPTLSDHMRGSARAAMDSLADSLVAHGIRSISGHIYSGSDNFPGPHVGEGWDWDDLDSSDGAGVDELLFNEGMSRVATYGPRGDSVVKSVPAAEPTLDYLRELQLALQSRGVRAAMGVGQGVVPVDGTPLDTIMIVRSVPLKDILRFFLKPSQNQMGEVLMRTIGLERTGVGVADSGIAVSRRQLTAWGIPRDGYELHDGSGMARADLVSPETLVRILQRMSESPTFAIFYDALPIAAVDGTIAHRMAGTPAANNVHAKTGSLHWVRSLSGYVTDADGQRLIFSVLANKWTTPPSSVTMTADSIAAALASYRR
ncbi:MAG: D-alanyl-D-alanine carboxypeptidase/D-alanyl-D-alanine-endopeptidase [Gemmatimonadota bacterium]|nr:D-alanyl-D-alanine carboxypeptidase/D-alanyl-D-alanine-endopeptidase [Gemmatimonadota bacterium]